MSKRKRVTGLLVGCVVALVTGMPAAGQDAGDPSTIRPPGAEYFNKYSVRDQLEAEQNTEPFVDVPRLDFFASDQVREPVRRMTPPPVAGSERHPSARDGEFGPEEGGIEIEGLD